MKTSLLSRLGYLASYSDRGRFYTLNEIPDFDDLGLVVVRFGEVQSAWQPPRNCGGCRGPVRCRLYGF